MSFSYCQMLDDTEVIVKNQDLVPAKPQDELHLGPELPRDASVEHLIMTSATSVVVNAAMATQVRRSLDAWEAQRHWDEL